MLTSKITTTNLQQMNNEFFDAFVNALQDYYGTDKVPNETLLKSVFSNIIEEKEFYNEEWFLFVDTLEENIDARIIKICKIIGRNYVSKIIAYVNSTAFTFASPLKPKDIELKTHSTNDTKKILYGKNINDNTTSSAKAEIAPINANLYSVNTPASKNESEINNNTETTGEDNENITTSGSINTTRENFEHMLKYLEYYAEKGNILYNMLESEINKFVADKITMF